MNAMRKRFALVTALALAAAWAGAAPAEDFHWQGTVAAGKLVEIKGVNGNIDAVAASGSSVEVTARKHARRSDPAEVDIKVVEHAGGVTICAVYPTPSGKSPNECLPGEHGRMNTHDNDVEVTFSVKLPRGVQFAARTVNGGVEATGLGGDVNANTVNGSVHVATAGHAEAETVNGSIEATLGRADWTGPARFKTVNGSIRLDLPATIDADVKAATVNGDIETDFPLTVTGRFSHRKVTGTIGHGGHDLDLETVNGNIELRKGK